MDTLLDTHSFLWLLGDTAKLSPAAHAHLKDPGNRLLLSYASGWEISIKFSLGKLSLKVPRSDLLTSSMSTAMVDRLPIRAAHFVAVSTLPFHHRDPFDRLITAQALTEALPIVSIDPTLDQYGVKRIW
jgi:PIN domain nuclease of toxin-antitoxin system